MYIGTGFLVDPQIVLTAGHCIFHGESNDVSSWLLPDVLEFLPGKSRNLMLYNGRIVNWREEVDPVVSESVFFHPNWRDGDKRYDIGGVLLEKPLDLDFFFSPTNIENEDILKEKYAITGYPGDLDRGERMYTMKGGISKADDHFLHYKIDTSGGQSGSPIWRTVKDSDTHNLCRSSYYGDRKI